MSHRFDVKVDGQITCSQCGQTRAEVLASTNPKICDLAPDAPGTGSGSAPAIETTSAEWTKPDKSASAIAKTYPEIYDIFAQVCVAGTYVANTRLQQLVESHVDPQQVISFQCTLQRFLRYVDTFRNIPGGSETNLVDYNLQSMLKIMADFSNGKLACAKSNYMKHSTHLAGSASPEHCLHFSCGLPSSQIVVGSEVKGVETSVRNCLPQLLSVCGSSCIEMHRLGLSREDCVVPGIVMAGASCQFLAVYLLRDNFPVLVALSPELSPFGTLQEQRAIAEWCLRLVSFAVGTADRLLVPREVKGSKTGVTLNMSGYFAKPVQSGWKLLNQQSATSDGDETTLMVSDKSIRLNHIMRLYEQIRVACIRQGVDVKQLILFPEGVVSLPSETVEESKALRDMLIRRCKTDGFTNLDLCYCPLILFPRLSLDDGWCNNKPSTKHRESYLAQLHAANNALNVAHVAHLDMRPANIMWRARDELSLIELRLIDFEDAQLFDHVIPSEFVTFVVNCGDSRYPFKRGDEETVQVAKKFHNDFFFEAVSKWTASEEVSFRLFMDENGAEIYSAATTVDTTDTTAATTVDTAATTAATTVDTAATTAATTVDTTATTVDTTTTTAATTVDTTDTTAATTVDTTADSTASASALTQNEVAATTTTQTDSKGKRFEHVVPDTQVTKRCR